ncbi:MAG: Asp-tRNA(Asn)/Glu-tRNA(Gln) amidotransferase subunit GatC [Firmicutes bacterium]|nr:Asp-tRNA(Asn)/Glu-tRNA(Gln) amidotransferase subunit GatC [Bacillota bacterium]
MAISRAEVEHVARLARLGLTEAEIEALTEQLGRILAHMEVLRQVDTRDVPPTYHVLPLQNVLRTDTVQESLSQEAALRNAPQAEAGAFKVPKITEG